MECSQQLSTENITTFAITYVTDKPHVHRDTRYPVTTFDNYDRLLVLNIALHKKKNDALRLPRHLTFIQDYNTANRCTGCRKVTNRI